jgi:DNA invertase Pin-like site-specific DNA recombinase
MAGIVAYFRVSTRQQGELGLEGQASAVATFAKQAGKPIVARYIEVETGKRVNRPELGRAISHARRAKATLVISRLDRLAHNVAFTSALMQSGVDFLCCDNPHANELTIHILAAVAEHESKRISNQMKAALAAAKARGTLLGSARPGHWDGKESIREAALVKARTVAAKTISENTREAYADLLPVIQEMREKGSTLQRIADELNAQGHTTRRGRPWNQVQVARVLERAKAARVS